MRQVLKKIIVLWFKIRLGKYGRNSWLSPKGVYLYPKKIEIGNNVYIGHGATISCKSGLKIGDGVTIGPGLTIMGGDHNFHTVGKRLFEVETGGENLPVLIEDDVWIGAKTIILKGVVIGEGSVIGAGSVVTKKIPPYTICAGNPARKINPRFSDEDLKAHLKIVESRYEFDKIRVKEK
ncbi:MAG: acyltransferase [Desulfobacula sp.]|uniref:acyltransferase n=1 Tax=Desulfobacula sp. TaxID=2593537 RepID=UPI001D830EE4|nr:acyltransferase [Desulfobacula sp.]MBT3487422.1 acyltransferase [Desulfobacula sp.]MBT3806950.1 acyltransferase [Desulfobacula sp.]MBT4026577.1 acyltransferase [Desulfobacula sp.]MBT4506719.1 acyltransferase [Desulfobacula sp.]